MPFALRAVLFTVFLVVVLGGLGLHLSWRSQRSFGVRLGRTLIALLVVGVLSTLLARAGVLGGATPFFGSLGAVLVLGVLISSVLLWPYELGRALLALGRAARRLVAGSPAELAPPPASEGPDLTPATATAPWAQGRRSFVEQVAVGGALTVGFGASTYGGLFGRHDYALETVPIKLAKLPRALDGFTIVQLSDIHFGTYVGEREFRSGLELVRRARPDLVVLTGDLVDHDPSYARELGRFVHELRAASKRGVCAIPGNHDYYAGVEHVLRSLRESGAEVLVNRHVRIGDRGGSFVLGGCDDVMAEGFGGQGPDVEATFRGADPELARVLLSHNPSHYTSAHEHADLVLSGHTHGGQITLFINPAELVLAHGYVRGHYLRGASQLYVNRGFGTAGPPARVGSPPEVTKLVLTSA
jgi:predicted MPP superfamily phosphohydrolase